MVTYGDRQERRHHQVTEPYDAANKRRAQSYTYNADGNPTNGGGTTGPENELTQFVDQAGGRG